MSTALAARIQAELDGKTKPPGALGRLEELALRLALAQGRLRPQVDPMRLLLFAADHGVAAEGVSAYPSSVTAAMVQNFLAGGAAASVLSRRFDVGLEVIDVGVARPIAPAAGLIVAKVRAGTRNLRVEDAMSGPECRAAVAVGRAAVRRAVADGVRTLLLGEMGIGNSTAAAAVLAGLTGWPAGRVVGAGTGVHGRRRAHKRAVVAEAVARVQRSGGGLDPWRLLTAVGGLELAALVGALLEARRRRRVVVVDGFIVSAAVAIALSIEPELRPLLVYAHRSAEAGHRRVLQWLGGEPLLDLGLRLGEGSGALLAAPLLRAAVSILNDMASMAAAGIAGPVVATRSTERSTRPGGARHRQHRGQT